MGQISIRLPDKLVGEIGTFCAEHHTRRSDLVRAAIQLYIDLKTGEAYDPKRIAVLCEFTQIVADEWVMRNAPEKRDEFLAAVDARLEQHRRG